MDITLGRVKDNLLKIDVDIDGILQFIHVVVDTQRSTIAAQQTTIQAQQATIANLQAQLNSKEQDAMDLAALSSNVRQKADDALADINPPVQGS